jgi:excisionase family DNA binding protein
VAVGVVTFTPRPATKTTWSDKVSLRLHTIPEAAQLLSVHRSTLYDLIARGELRVVDLSTGGSRTKSRVRSDDLDAFIEARTRTAPRTTVTTPEGAAS